MEEEQADAVPHRHVEDMLRRVWRDAAVPDAELEFLHSLSRARAETVRRRLRSMVELDAAEAAGLPASIGDAQRRSGVGRTFFYLLRQRWREHRRLADLAPHERPVLVDKGEALNEELVARVRDAFRAAPLAQDADLARQLKRGLGLAQDHRTIARLLHRERVDVQGNGDVLRDAFGRALLIDASAVSLSVRDGRRDQALVVALVVERATGLLLGHAAGVAPDGVDLQFKAIMAAMAFVAEERIDRASHAGELASALLVVGPGEGDEVAAVAAAARGGPAEVWSTGWRRHGEMAAAVLGRRVGRLMLKPMATASGGLGGGEAARFDEHSLTLPEAVRRVEGIVRRQQGALLERLREHRVVGRLPVGMMHRALSAVATDWP